MDIIIDIVKEWWHLIGDILFDIFVTCLWILISFKIIYELYVWLFSRPKSKIASEYGRQYELIKELIDLVNHDIQIAQYNVINDNDKKKILQLKGEVLRIRNLITSCDDINKITDKEKIMVLDNLLLYLKDLHQQMTADSDKDKNGEIYRIYREDIIPLCLNLRNVLNNKPSKSWLSNLIQNIKKIFCSKHNNPQIEEITKGLNEYITKIEKEVKKNKPT